MCWEFMSEIIWLYGVELARLQNTYELTVKTTMPRSPAPHIVTQSKSRTEEYCVCSCGGGDDAIEVRKADTGIVGGVELIETVSQSNTSQIGDLTLGQFAIYLTLYRSQQKRPGLKLFPPCPGSSSHTSTKPHPCPRGIVPSKCCGTADRGIESFMRRLQDKVGSADGDREGENPQLPTLTRVTLYHPGKI